MASKKDTTKSTKSAPKKKAPAKKAPAKKAATKKAPKENAEVKPVGPRHPKARVAALHDNKDGAKEALASQLASALATESEDRDTVASKLKTASNTQLLRLQRVVQVVKDKWGGREKLIAALGEQTKHGKDKDYVAKLGTFSLPRLLDMAQSAQRRAGA
jgi:hypothetical protein